MTIFQAGEDVPESVAEPAKEDPEVSAVEKTPDAAESEAVDSAAAIEKVPEVVENDTAVSTRLLATNQI